jgi:hypothetical protein
MPGEELDRGLPGLFERGERPGSSYELTDAEQRLFRNFLHHSFSPFYRIGFRF